MALYHALKIQRLLPGQEQNAAARIASACTTGRKCCSTIKIPSRAWLLMLLHLGLSHLRQQELTDLSEEGRGARGCRPAEVCWDRGPVVGSGGLAWREPMREPKPSAEVPLPPTSGVALLDTYSPYYTVAGCGAESQAMGEARSLALRVPACCF